MQAEQKRTERKELCVFLLWTYGLTFLLRCVHEPAAGVMLAKLLYSKDRSKLPKKVFITSLGFFICISIIALIWLFISDEIRENLSFELPLAFGMLI